ncbi:DUF4186 family protein [Agrobacterium pusense]|uniref:DUF4186 family protein n=1 Tax=Agrobacterium pusense TaxID=648995 RepID=UPI003D11DBDC
MTLITDLFDDLDKPLPDVKITCTSVSCDDDLHCFLQPRRAGGKPFFGACRGCPADPVDWPQAHKRDPAHIDELFKQQRKELIRYYMWSKPFDEAAKARVRKLGWDGTLGSIRKTLNSSVGKAAGAWDGRQTKLAEDVVCYAQHSTATCCRKCMKYWHDIPMDRSLTEEEIDYCELLIRRYLELRKPHLD